MGVHSLFHRKTESEKLLLTLNRKLKNDDKFISFLQLHGIYNKEINIIVSRLYDNSRNIGFNQASTSQLQRKYDLGYEEASKLIDFMIAIDVIIKDEKFPSGKKYNEDFGTAISNIMNAENIMIAKSFIQVPKNNISSGYVDIDNIVDGVAFEYYIADLLKGLEYTEVQVTKESNDYGIDVLAIKDSIKYAIQCKYYSGTVGNSSIQEATAGMKYYDAHIAVVATNSYFTTNAVELAKSNKVILWDRDKLLSMIEIANMNHLA